MTDRPEAATARLTVLHDGYAADRVASTVVYVADGDRHIVIDPGMVPTQAAIVDPLHAARCDPGDVTDVVVSHHHPDHTINVGLFPRARVHDFWAIYDGGPTVDPRATDQAQLDASRQRVLAVADVIVPGHGPAYRP
ncbi:MAG: MBL fold metallo-hydrolase [Actinobacteria bacterium]|nr:MBL fold metallo-hydrolase [Actinomycetota bacterium]